MSAWLSTKQMMFLVNKQILFDNPTDSFYIDLLRALFILLSSYLVLKSLLHIMVFQFAKSKFRKFSEEYHPALFRRLTEIVSRSGLKKIPQFYAFSNARPLIFAIGVLRPAIFISPRLLQNLSSEEAEAVITHEVTHIKRRDGLLLWLFEAVAAILPLIFMLLYSMKIVFDPQKGLIITTACLIIIIYLYGFLRERLVYSRELTCDDLTLQITNKPLVLASTIIKVNKIGRLLPAFSWANLLFPVYTFSNNSKSLEPRIKRLVDYKPPRYKLFLERLVPYVAGVLLCSFVALIAVAETKQGSAMIFIKKDNVSIEMTVELEDDPVEFDEKHVTIRGDEIILKKKKFGEKSDVLEKLYKK